MFLDKETERSVEKHHEGALPFEISVLYLLSVNPWLVCSESSCNSLEQLDAERLAKPVPGVVAPVTGGWPSSSDYEIAAR